VIPNVFAVVGDPIRLALVASQPAKRNPTGVRFSSQHDGAKFLPGLLKPLKGLESENAKLKKLLADTLLGNAALKDLLAKKW